MEPLTETRYQVKFEGNTIFSKHHSYPYLRNDKLLNIPNVISHFDQVLKKNPNLVNIKTIMEQAFSIMLGGKVTVKPIGKTQNFYYWIFRKAIEHRPQYILYREILAKKALEQKQNNLIATKEKQNRFIF